MRVSAQRESSTPELAIKMSTCTHANWVVALSPLRLRMLHHRPQSKDFTAIAIVMCDLTKARVPILRNAHEEHQPECPSYWRNL